MSRGGGGQISPTLRTDAHGRTHWNFAGPGGFGGGGPRMGGGGGGSIGRPHIGAGPRFSGHPGRPGKPGMRPPSAGPHVKPGCRPGHGHHHRPHRPWPVPHYDYGYYGGPLYDGYYTDSVVTYDDACGWLYRKARRTGKAYWWRR